MVTVGVISGDQWCSVVLSVIGGTVISGHLISGHHAVVLSDDRWYYNQWSSCNQWCSAVVGDNVSGHPWGSAVNGGDPW